MNLFKSAVLLLTTLALLAAFSGCGKGSVPPNVQPLNVGTRSLPAAVVGKSYSTTLSATGGVGPYTWTITSGSLPNGITMSASGVLSGTAAAVGTSNITVQVTDSQTPTAAVATGGLTLTVNNVLTITTKTLKTGAVNVPYSVTLNASGGTPPYTWSLASGSLPAGLSLVASVGFSGPGISGTPTAEGTSSFTLQVTDSENPAVSVTQAYTLTIGGADGRLSGNYVFLFRGFRNGKLLLQAGSFVSDGAGNITSGVADIVNNTGGSGNGHIQASLTGSYTLDDSGHGTMMLFFSAGTGTATYQLVASTGGYVSFIQNGDGQATTAGAGLIKAQSTIPTDLSLFGSADGAAWVFGGYGADVSNARYAAGGTFKVIYTTGNTSGTISSGLMDSNDNGTVKTGSTFTGTIQPPDTTTGRGTASFDTGGALAYYYVGLSNATGGLELIAIDTDSISVNNPMIMYTLREQFRLPGGYNNAALQGPALSELSAVPSPNAPDVSLGLLDFDGKATTYATIDDNSGGTLNQNKFTATYSVDSTGRTTFTGWDGSNPVMYLSSPVSAFVLGTDPAVTSGEIEFQFIQSSTHNPGNADFSGTYSGGSLAPVLASQTVEVDTDNADGAGKVSVSYDVSGGGSPPQQGLSLKATYNVDTNCPAMGSYGYTTCGRFPVMDSNNNQVGIGYLVNIFSTNRVVILTTNTKQPVINALQK